MAAVVASWAMVATVSALLSEDPYAAFALIITVPALAISGLLALWHLMSSVRRWDIHADRRRSMLAPLLAPLIVLAVSSPGFAQRVHDNRIQGHVNALANVGYSAQFDLETRFLARQPEAEPTMLAMLADEMPGGEGVLPSIGEVRLLDTDGDQVPDHILIGTVVDGWLCAPMDPVREVWIDRGPDPLHGWSKDRPVTCP